jgi:hypothetical protein
VVREEVILMADKKRYFTIADAVKYKYVPWSYKTALDKMHRGELKAVKLGNKNWTCIEWINESFDNAFEKGPNGSNN